MTAPQNTPYGKREFQLDRDWIWYQTWGRYAWNCRRDRSQEIDYWNHQLGKFYGTSDENAGLIPDVDRSGGNARMFSDYTLGWLRLVHCLRMTGLPIEGVKHYIDLCQEGDTTIPERAELIFKQEKSLREQLRILKKQMEVLKYKKKFYQDLLNNRRPDSCNPLNHVSASEPNIAPEE